MRIREARVEDAAILTAAEKKIAREPGLLISRPDELTENAFKEKIEQLSKTGLYIVAELNGEIVGHAFLDPMGLEAISHVFRLSIVVHHGYSNQGIGTALMAALIDWAKRNPDVGKIELLVRATNKRAIHLYSKFGFLGEGRLRKRLRLPTGDFIDDVAMAWFPENN